MIELLKDKQLVEVVGGYILCGCWSEKGQHGDRIRAGYAAVLAGELYIPFDSKNVKFSEYFTPDGCKEFCCDNKPAAESWSFGLGFCNDNKLYLRWYNYAQSGKSLQGDC
jgi:hypothetical protein